MQPHHNPSIPILYLLYTNTVHVNQSSSHVNLFRPYVNHNSTNVTFRFIPYILVCPSQLSITLKLLSSFSIHLSYTFGSVPYIDTVAETVDGIEVGLLVTGKPYKVDVTLQCRLYLSTRIGIVHIAVNDSL